ncbi:Histone methylation protein [Phytophthora megakarya]|uniref:Histone methylation protein n=1 Tax=Phytophthora megakarya TaxID=4795 RepID=A0A225V0G4_9STRA|nr:Histone methylation protein [Phytophthora megakarya]
MAKRFGDVCASDVRQLVRQTHGNVGPLKSDDIFVDIGSGIGNIMVQIALTTKAHACTGIEVRSELCDIAETRIQSYLSEWPLLKKVSTVASDLRDVSLSTTSPMCDSTVVLANNVNRQIWYYLENFAR